MCKHTVKRVPFRPKDNNNMRSSGEQGASTTVRTQSYQSSQAKRHNPASTAVQNGKFPTTTTLHSGQRKPKYTRMDKQNNNHVGCISPNENTRPANRYSPSRMSPNRQLQNDNGFQCRNDVGYRKSPTLPLSKSPVTTPATSQSAYAGPKFSDPPSPKVLPKPPISWVSRSDVKPHANSCAEMTSVLKVMLKVQS